MVLLFLWLGPQQSLLNMPTSSASTTASPSATGGSVALAPTASGKKTPPGQAKKTTPTATPSYPVLPSLPPGYSPTPTPSATPTATPIPSASQSATPTPTPAPTPASAPKPAFTYSPATPLTGIAVSFDGRASVCYATPCSYVWSPDADAGADSNPDS